MALEADFQTAALGEHIVIGRAPSSRFLWLGKWPDEEVGWWYTFFFPATIAQADVGVTHFGFQRYPALRLVYSASNGVEQSVYLAFEDDLGLQRVWTSLPRSVRHGAAQKARRATQAKGQDA